jgi:glutathione S-transferase
MKLFYSPASPFARKVRVAAIELGLADRLELEIADLAPGKPNRAYAEAYNPLRKLPTLVADDGTRLFDSTVICEYLDGLAGGGIILPRESSLRWTVLTNHALAQGMTEAAILFRYETAFRPEPHRWPVWIEDQWDRIEAGMKWFNENSAELAEPLNIAHFALGSLLGYIEFRMPERAWRPRYPLLREWFERIERRPSFAQTRPVAPPGAPLPAPAASSSPPDLRSEGSKWVHK